MAYPFFFGGLPPAIDVSSRAASRSSAIAVDLVRPDGSATQLCVAEPAADGGERKLHVLSWDGDRECAVHEQVVNPDGAYPFEFRR